MRLFARHRAEMPSRAPSHRLLWASLLLALLLLLTFGAALFLFISLHNTKKKIPGWQMPAKTMLRPWILSISQTACPS